MHTIAHNRSVLRSSKIALARLREHRAKSNIHAALEKQSASRSPAH
jgi:hypothetical protein